MAAETANNRIRAMTFSSEKAVVQRWFGGEILDHSPKSVRMGFMKSGKAPLLKDHDMRQQIGIIPKASIVDKMGSADARFGRSLSADQALQDVDDTILVNTSVGYRVYEMVLDSQKKGEEDIYRVIDWEPYEVSLVAVPADTNVGVGREAEEIPTAGAASINSITQETRTMANETGTGGAGSGNGTGDTTQTRVTGGEPNATGAGGAGAELARRGVEQSALMVEESRVKSIKNLCKANNIEERMERVWITGGTSVEGVTEDLLRVLEARGKSGQANPASKLGLSNDEVQRFSLVKAIRACADGNWTDAGFEAECSRTIASRINKPADPKRFFVPYDVQQRGINPRDIRARDLMRGGQTRADTVGAGANGGYLVATELVSFIDLLRNRAVAFRMGARSLAGLVGNVTIPKLTGAATAFWLGSETTQIQEKEQVFSQLAMTPHNVGGYTEISRQLLMQSTPDVEGIVNSDLAIISALAIDLGAISGTGTGGQPVGITNTTGIGSATGADMSTIAYQGVLDFQTAVWNANVIPVRGGYVTFSDVAQKLMTRTKFPNTYSPLWDGTLWDADVAGFPGMSSKQMTAGNMIFGDWDQLIIAEWGVLELEVNPYANFQAGIIGVRAFMTCDIGLRYPGAFCQNGAAIT